jgi:branched-chain amino acid transport system permease protein
MQELWGAIALGSIYMLFALGISIAWGTIDVLNFGHGSIFMFSAYVAHLAVGHSSFSLPVLLVLGAVVGAAMSVAMQLLAFETIVRRAKDRITAERQQLIFGIGIAVVPLAIVQNRTKSNPFGLLGSSFTVKASTLGPVRVTNVQVVTVILTIVLGIALALWLARSRQGLALRAIGVDRETAALMGVDRRKLAVMVMAIAGALAGLSGILLTFSFSAITADSDSALLMKAFAIIIVGGVGSIVGVAIGSFVLAMAETLVLTNTNGLWVEAIAFGLIFAMLLVKPSGLFGIKEVRRT